MYSRYHGREDRPVQLPKDYGGSAFSSGSVLSEPSVAGRIEIARPTVAESESITEPAQPSVPAVKTVREQETSPQIPSSLTPGLLPMGRGFPIAHGIGFEELLILGLILLLSQSEAGADTVMWLCLLLFCG